MFQLKLRISAQHGVVLNCVYNIKQRTPLQMQTDHRKVICLNPYRMVNNNVTKLKTTNLSRKESRNGFELV